MFYVFAKQNYSYFCPKQGSISKLELADIYDYLVLMTWNNWFKTKFSKCVRFQKCCNCEFFPTQSRLSTTRKIFKITSNSFQKIMLAWFDANITWLWSKYEHYITIKMVNWDYCMPSHSSSGALELSILTLQIMVVELIINIINKYFIHMIFFPL